MKMNRRVGALASIAVLAALLVPAGPAHAATTYEVQLGADFFGQGVPGFSLRAFPTSIDIMQGDTLNFTNFGAPPLLPAGQVPQEWAEKHDAHLGDDWFDLLPDPDDGPDATKFNIAVFNPNVTCEATQASPCEYDGSGSDPFIPPFFEGDGPASQFVTITAPPGSVIWGYIGSGVPPLRIEVVTDPSEADTQAEVDARGAQQLSEDYNEALALHNKYSAKKTWHINEQGQKVFDVWVGPGRKWIETLAMYPKKIKIRKGQRVQYHFNFENEVHTVAMSKESAFDIMNNTFFPQCDPDGDAGEGPDNMPNFEAETEFELCPDIAQLEFDMDPREIFGAGNGVFNGKASDVEASGIKGHESFTGGLINDDPYTVRFKNASNRRGFKYVCTIHGNFMSGRVRVKA